MNGLGMNRIADIGIHPPMGGMKSQLEKNHFLRDCSSCIKCKTKNSKQMVIIKIDKRGTRQSYTILHVSFSIDYMCN